MDEDSLMHKKFLNILIDDNINPLANTNDLITEYNKKNNNKLSDKIIDFVNIKATDNLLITCYLGLYLIAHS